MEGALLCFCIRVTPLRLHVLHEWQNKFHE
jgi:hypothetical protein